MLIMRKPMAQWKYAKLQSFTTQLCALFMFSFIQISRRRDEPEMDSSLQFDNRWKLLRAR